MDTEPLTAGPSDEDLIAAFQKASDVALLQPVIERHLGRIRSMLFQMTMDDSAADDLTQEVFLRAIRGLPKFNGQSRLATWLYRIAMNTAHTYLRKAARCVVAADMTIVEAALVDASPAQAASRREFERDVEAAISELSPKLRAGIVLTSLQGLSPREAAEVEGCSESTMYWRVHEARKQLQQKLRKHLS